MSGHDYERTEGGMTDYNSFIIGFLAILLVFVVGIGLWAVIQIKKEVKDRK